MGSVCTKPESAKSVKTGLHVDNSSGTALKSADTNETQNKKNSNTETVLPDVKLPGALTVGKEESTAAVDVKPSTDAILSAAQQMVAEQSSSAEGDGKIRENFRIYLLYSTEDAGSLIQKWSANPAEGIPSGNYKLFLTVIPAPHRRAPKNKFDKGGFTRIFSKMEEYQSWAPAKLSEYLSAWAQVLKLADDNEGDIILESQDVAEELTVRIIALHTGPVGNKLAIVPLNQIVKLSSYTLVGVLPGTTTTKLKEDSNITERQFIDLLAKAGGVSRRNSRRGSDAQLGEADLIKWMEEDGLKMPKPGEEGGGFALDLTGKYERGKADRV